MASNCKFADEFLKLHDYDPKSDVMPHLTKEQFSYLASDLQDCHSLFYTLWQLGTIKFIKNPDLPTAAIFFSRQGDGEAIEFVFNPDFWQRCNHITRLFVIMHECLHVALKHGLRMKDCHPLNRDIVNAALDIVCNHAVVEKFGIDRDQIQEWTKYSWVETHFPGKNISNDKYFEYYLGLLKQNASKFTAVTVDNHGILGDSMSGGKISDEILKKVNDLISEKDKKKIRDILEKTEDIKDNKIDKDLSKIGMPAGSGTGGKIWTFKNKDSNPVRKWKSLIKTFYRKTRHAQGINSQWARTSRRFSLMKQDLMIPSMMEGESISKNKVDAWFFIDCSGSCESMVPRFVQCYQTVPKKYFVPKAFSFDDDVTPIINGHVRGGGGTSFSAIENFIQSEIRTKGLKYPHICVIITDGAGNKVNPQYPKRWWWLMPQGCPSNLIPKDCNIEDLETFEK